ncbi:MAG: tetratricopeptide repeat protein [Planctomycetota bacterium]|nr:tetratricopeptide repeat protein [Planctomycetota bacterium]
MAKAENVGAIFFTLAVLGLILGGGYMLYQKNKPEDPAQKVQDLYTQGRRALNATQYQASVNTLTEAIELDPDRHDAYRVRGEALAWLGDHYGAIHDFTVAINGGLADADTYFRRGQASQAVDQLEDAKSDFKIVLELEPDHRRSHQELGELCLELGQFELAGEYLREAVARVPSAASAWRTLGWSSWGIQRYDDAIESFSKAIEEDEFNLNGHLGRGVTRVFMGRFEESLTDLKHATSSSQQRTDYAHFFLYLTRLRLGLDDAASQTLRAHKSSRRPDSGADWPGSVTEFLLGEMTEEQLLERINETGSMPDPLIAVEGYYYIAMMRMFAGDEAGAIEAFRRSLDTKVYHYYEYHASQAELNRLGASANDVLPRHGSEDEEQ